MPSNPRPAYVDDYDEDSGRTVKGSRRSAKEKSKGKKQRSSEKAKRKPEVNYPSPQRERPAVRIPQEKNVAIITEREVKQDRRNSTSSNSPLSPRKSTKRPPSAHENKPSHHQIERKAKDEPAHFGLVPPVSRPAPPVLSQSMQNTIAQPIATRPRAVTSNTYPRPLSFHSGHNSVGGAYGPPLSTSAWSNYQPPNPYTYASSPSYTQNPYPQMAAPIPPPGSDYFPMSLPERPVSTRPLSSRFEAPPSRTASGFGMREHGMRDPLPQERNSSYNTVYHDDAYASASEGAIVKRRESIREPSSRPARTPSRLSRDYHADAHSMPPPPRPILRRPVTDHPSEYPSQDPYRDVRSEGRTIIGEPSRRRRTSTHRNSVTYDIPDDRDHDRDEDREQDSSRTRHRRSNSHRNSGAYNDIVTDMGRMSIETANNGRRRASYYGQSTAQSGHTASTGSSGYEDKMREAAGYQDDVGGSSIPLTAEVLKRQQRRQAGSSRSTKSSASRDESDYRKSVTTRTTRSGSGDNDENVTIKVTGTTRVVVGGARIECPDGGEIEIKRQRSMRNGSERSNSEYGVPIWGQQQIDDRRSRVDQPTTNRARQSSQHSYTRSTQYIGDNYF